MASSVSSWNSKKGSPVHCSILQSIEGTSPLGGLTAAVVDGDRVWAATGESITLRNQQTGEIIETIQPQEVTDTPITHMISCCGCLWAVTSSGQAQVYTMQNKKQRHSIIISDEPVTGVAVFDSTVYLTTTSSLKLYDGFTGQCTKWWTVPRAATSVTVLSQQVIVTGHSNGQLRYWDSDGSLIREHEAHSGDVTALLRKGPPSPSLISGGSDSIIKIWGTDGNSPTAELRGHSSAVKGLVAVSSFLLASCSLDGRIVLWDLKALKSVGALDQHGSPLVALSVAQSVVSSVLWSYGSDQSLTVWGLRHGLPEQSHIDELTEALTRKERLLRAAHEELEKVESTAAVSQREPSTSAKGIQTMDCTPTPPVLTTRSSPIIATSSVKIQPVVPDFVKALASLCQFDPAIVQQKPTTPLELLSQGKLINIPQEWSEYSDSVLHIQSSLNDRWDALHMSESNGVSATTVSSASKKMSQQLQQCNEKIARLTTSTVSHLNNRIEDLMFQLHNKEIELRDASLANAKSKSTEESLTTIAQQRRNQIEKMTSVQQQLTEDLSSRDYEIQTLQRKLKEVSDMSDCSAEIESLQMQKQLAEEESNKLQSENAELVVLLDKYRQPLSRTIVHTAPQQAATTTATETFQETFQRLTDNGQLSELKRRLGYDDMVADHSSELQHQKQLSRDRESEWTRERQRLLSELERMTSTLNQPKPFDFKTASEEIVERGLVQQLMKMANISTDTTPDRTEEVQHLNSQIESLEKTIQESKFHQRDLIDKNDLLQESIRTIDAELALAKGHATNINEKDETINSMQGRILGWESDVLSLRRSLPTLKQVMTDLTSVAEIDCTPLGDVIRPSRDDDDEKEINFEIIQDITSQLRLVIASLRTFRESESNMKNDVVSLHQLVEVELKRIEPSAVQSDVTSPARLQHKRLIHTTIANMRLLIQSWHRAEVDLKRKSDDISDSLSEARQLLAEQESASELASQSQGGGLRPGTPSHSSRSLQTPSVHRGNEDLQLLRQALENKSREYSALQQEIAANRQRMEEKHKRISALQELTEDRSRMLQEERHKSYQLQREVQYLKNRIRKEKARPETEELEDRLAEAEERLSSERDEKITALQHKLQEVEKMLETSEKRNSPDLSERVQCLEQQLREAKEQVQLQQELLASQSEDAAEERILEYQEKISLLESDVADLETRLQQSLSDHRSAEARCSELENENRAVKDSIQKKSSRPPPSPQRDTTRRNSDGKPWLSPPVEKPTTPVVSKQSQLSAAITASPPDPRPDLTVQRAQISNSKLDQNSYSNQHTRSASGSGNSSTSRVSYEQQRGRSGMQAPPPQYSFPPQTQTEPTNTTRAMSPVEQRRIKAGLMKEHNVNIPYTNNVVRKASPSNISTVSTQQPTPIPTTPIIVAAIPSPERSDLKPTLRRKSAPLSPSTNTSSISSSALMLSNGSSPSSQKLSVDYRQQQRRHSSQSAVTTSTYRRQRH